MALSNSVMERPSLRSATPLSRYFLRRGIATQTFQLGGDSLVRDLAGHQPVNPVAYLLDETAGQRSDHRQSMLEG